MVTTTKRDSGNDCLALGILSLLLVFVATLVPILPAQAADSALSGLGEPAAPESMASPTELFPASSSHTSPGVSTAPMLVPKSTGGKPVPQPAASSATAGTQQVGNPVLLRPAQGGAAPSSSNSNFIFRPHIEKQETGPLTLKGAIDYADQNYPTIKKGIALVTSAQQGVTLQKLNE